MSFPPRRFLLRSWFPIVAVVAMLASIGMGDQANWAQEPPAIPNTSSPVAFGQPVQSQPSEPENSASAAAIAATQPALSGGSGPKVGAAGDMIGFSHSDGGGTQTITLVDTSKAWMAVYHIDRSGKIRLVSSRPIEADFSLQLNATAPLPNEIRQLGGR
ncbi:hypothetical protein N9N28_06115 [Rubripirellula amarantea]|uniref:Uncharacterized protein n=1 Tax=Rubripirellula amarantea TaxID=2527999 RepID=A0A5C5WQU6_9BACT|nr:hypothetical protein [Rubripirellula amarantea]MDA8744191.1 hypothetical protein [Rubripirellula amarantea]TWT53264.1 hypothetical protein Pla22_08920 [Rubripirellula amarantea]